MNATTILTDLLFDETDVVFDAVCNVADTGCEKNPLCNTASKPIHCCSLRKSASRSYACGSGHSMTTGSTTRMSSQESSTTDVGDRNMRDPHFKRGSPMRQRDVRQRQPVETIVEQQVQPRSARDQDKIPETITIQRDISSLTDSSLGHRRTSDHVGRHDQQRHHGHAARRRSKLPVPQIDMQPPPQQQQQKRPSSMDIYNIIADAVRRNRFSVGSSMHGESIQSGNSSGSVGKHSFANLSRQSSKSLALDLCQLSTLDPQTKLKIKHSGKRLRLVANSDRNKADDASGTSSNSDDDSVNNRHAKAGRVTDCVVTMAIGKYPENARYSGEARYKSTKAFTPDDEESEPSQFTCTPLPHGVGVMRFNNGDYYIGEFRRGKLEGKGTLVFDDKTLIKGKFKNNRFVA